MKHIIVILISSLMFFGCSTSKNSVATENDNKAFEKLRIDIFEAFANGDLQTITSYHHPDVVKALAYNKFLIGRNAVIENLKGTLQYCSLSFKEHKIESFQIMGNTATEISSFTIEGTPRGGDKPFVFKGRSMVVYTRYKLSPAGWALIREVIQPAAE